MRILLISSFLPYPLFSGGHIRLFNIVKKLSENHEITLLCEKRDYQTGKDIEEVEKFCKSVIVFRRRKQWSVSNLIKTAFSKEPFLVVGHTNKLMRKKIAELLSLEKFDVIHAETFYIMQNIPQTQTPIVLVEHNIEYLVYKRYADLVPLFFKLLFYADVWKLKRCEQSFWLRSARIIAVSEEEKEIVGLKNVSVVSNGVDIERFKMKNSKVKKIMDREKKILFIGDFKWLQNRDAAMWIIESIWPKIKSKFKNQKAKIEPKFWVVGKAIPDTIRRATGDQDVVFDEGADDTFDIFQQADILVAPIRVGGGTSFKILEAMASGVPVVTTSLGIEGINAQDKEEVLIAETAEEIAVRAVEVLQSNSLHEAIAKKARRLIEKKYNWEIIVKGLEKVYKSVLETNH